MPDTRGMRQKMKIEHASSFSRLLWTSGLIQSGLFCDGK
jgi:hypothetical protein